MLLEIKEIERSTYADFLRQQHGATVFHQTTWLDVIAATYKIAILYLGAYENTRLNGVCPVFVRKIAFLKLLGAPLPKLKTHMPEAFVGDGVSTEDISVAFDSWARTRRLSYFQLCSRAQFPTYQHGAVVEERYTLQMKLEKSLEDIWKGVDSKTRNRVRFAVRSEVKAHWTTHPDFPRKYRELLDSTYQAQGIALGVPDDLHANVYAALIGKNLKVITATHKGQTIAALWILHANDTCYYWDGASDQSYRHLSASHLLLWEVIRWANKRGFKVFDMVGGGKGRVGGRPGIGHFKKSFGAQPVPYNAIYWQHGWVRQALQLYRFIQKLKDKPRAAR